MKFILLDIDGVMVPASGWKPVECESDGFYKFNKVSQDCLINLISESNANIVLISSHKNRFTSEVWFDIFKRRIPNLKSISIIDDIVSTKISDKYKQILEWDIEYGHNKYVIIDDDRTLFMYPENIKSHWVKTDSLIGLNSEKMIESIKILNNA